MALTDILIELEIRKYENESGKYVLDINVTRYQNIQAEIFVYARDTNSGNDSFSHIASPNDIASLPKHHHQPGNIYFVENSVELEFDTAQQRDDTESLILDDVRELKDNWELVKDQLDTTYKVII